MKGFKKAMSDDDKKDADFSQDKLEEKGSNTAQKSEAKDKEQA